MSVSGRSVPELPPSSSVSVFSSLSCSPNIIFRGFCFLDLRFSELLSDKFSACPGESADPVVSLESGLRLAWLVVSRSGGLTVATVLSRAWAEGYCGRGNPAAIEWRNRSSSFRLLNEGAAAAQREEAQ